MGKRALCLEKQNLSATLNENNTGKLIKKFKLNQLGTYDDIWKNFGLTLKNKTKICSGDKVLIPKNYTIYVRVANKEKVIYFK